MNEVTILWTATIIMMVITGVFVLYLIPKRLGGGKGNVSVVVITILAVFLALSVSAAGYLYLQNQKSQQVANSREQLASKNTPTPALSPTPVPTTSSEMANWKTYSDSRYQFQLKYPSNWEFQIYQNGYVVAFRDKGANSLDGFTNLSVGVLESTSLEKWTSDNTSNSLPQKSWNPRYLEDTVVSGIPAKKFMQNLAIGRTIYIIVFNHNSNLYTVSSFEVDKTFDQILSTFKFTN